MIGLEQLVATINRLIADAITRELERRGVTPDRPQYVTVAEYARARNISEKTVRVAIAEHRLEVLRVGRAVRIPANAVIARRSGRGNARALTVLMGGKNK